MRLGTMRGAEIFATGFSRGRYWSAQDLDEIVRNYELARGVVEPPLAVGHEDEQALTAALAADPSWTAHSAPTFKHNSGSPAIGWPTNVRREGSKLKADIENIPGKIADLMQARMFHRFSAELYPKPPEDAPPECKGWMLKRVSLLGAQLPERKTLADWHALLFGEGAVEVEPWLIKAAALSHQRPSGVWEVFYECEGGQTVDRKAQEKRLLDAGYNPAQIALLASVPDDKFSAYVEETLKNRVPPPPVPAPVPAPVPPVIPPAIPVAHPVVTPQQFAELTVTAAQLKTDLDALKTRQAAEEAESRRRQAAERTRSVETYCERWARDNYVLPRDVDKTAKVPNLYNRLMSADGNAVRKFGEVEMTEFDSIVAEVEARGPGFARRHFSEQIEQPNGSGADDQVTKEAKEYAERRNKKAG